MIFFELVAGAPPFTGESPLELVHAHVARPPPSPCSLVATVPAMIEAIVLKLLAKAADERYQSADGLRIDLDRCRVALEESGTIDPFALGELDRPPQLTVADRLFGAEQLIHRLLAAHERASRGGRELVLLAGAPGSGKSRVLQELVRLFQGRGLVLVGRCDGADDPPFAALSSALRSRIRALLAADDGDLVAWRSELHRVVGDGGAVLCQLLPELAALLRPQGPPPEVPPSEAAQRLETLVDGMIRTLPCGRAPLVLLVDDAHWIDPTAADAIARLLADDRARSICIIAAHSGELAVSHPLRAAAAAAAGGAARVTEERIPPIALADTASLLRESLTPTTHSVRALAEHVHARAGGSPLFARVLLERLHEDGAIRFDRRAAGWVWTVPPADAAPSGDVVALLMARIAELPSSSRAVLETAACVGLRFEVALVARVLGRSTTAIDDDLDPALRRQIIGPSGDAYEATTTHVFTHPRVQEALLAGIDEGRRRALHLALGEQLRRECGDFDDRIFAAVAHSNRAVELLVGEEARVSLARANLRAGRRAALVGAAAVAERCFTQALALMPEDGWRSHHELMRSIHLAAVEALSHLGDDRAAPLFARALAEARSDLDRAEILAVRVSLELGDLRFEDALSTARAALRHVGVDLPSRGARRSFALELAKVRWRLRRRSARAFLDAPASVDRRTHLAHRLLMYVMPAVHHLDPRLTAIVLLRLAGLTLERGRTEYSPYGVAGYGMVQSAVLGEHASAYESLQIADTMLRQAPQPWIEPKIDFLAGFLILPWIQPIAEAQRRLDKGHRGALQRGDLLYAGLCGLAIPPFALFAGQELPRIQETCAELQPLTRRLEDESGAALLTAIHRACQALRGQAIDPTLLGANGEEDAALFASVRRNTVAGFAVPLYKALLLYHAGMHVAALPYLERAGASRIAVQGTPLPADHDFYAALTHAEVALQAEAPIRRKHLTTIGAHVANLAKMAATSRENFGPRWRIAAAMAAWVGGDDDTVLPGLSQAIVDARAQDDPFREGLAAELAARFAHEHRLAFLVDDYADVAAEAYARVGAHSRVAFLRRAYGRGATSEAGETPTPPEEVVPGVLVDPGTGKSLDLATVIKATQALSSEIVLDRLLTNLLRIVMENAGARRCFLVLEHEGRLSIEAEGSVDPERIEVLQSVPLDAHTQLPLSIINYVARSSSTVVLDNAAQRGSYTKDEYVREQGLKSVLCLPILQNNRVSGVLYLENNLATGVFTAERLELLNQLAAQVAISVDNARLYESLDRARQVAVAADQAKTRFLMTMSHELRTPLNAIIGYTELIEEELEDGHIGNFADDLGSVRTAALRLERTLQSTLELSRIEAGTFEIEWETVHVADIVRDVLNELRPAAIERGVPLEIAMPASLPPITADRVRIRYVLLSLLDNAIRFSEGTPAQLTVRWALDDAAPILEIIVRDRGIGIAEEHMPRIFKSFSQADGSTTRLYEGSGVSLAVTQHICNRMGGTVGVESEVGDGSTFTVRLPVQPAL
ncbi:MAG: AAA family ATPase [Nannocystaceae bacterium]